MCFLNDYDWTASVCEAESGRANRNIQCAECGADIQPGEFVHSIYMQEHEECGACEDGDCECPEHKCCACENPSIGETFDYDRCEQCHKFLQAVEAAEVEAGCAPRESRPGLGSMMNEIQDGTSHEAKKYFRAALRMFPEIASSGYLGKLWNQMFV